jgi:hypothetical protein
MTGTARPPELAPEEIAALEASARELIAAFQPAKARRAEKNWEPEKPVVAALDESNISGPVWTATPDPRTDRIVARAVGGNGRHLELDEEGCAQLDLLAERWASLPAFVGLTTIDAMRERLQRWCAAILLDALNESCVPFIVAALTEELDTHEVWIQLSGIDVEHRFQLGKVDLCGISPTIIDRWLTEARDAGFSEASLDLYKVALSEKWQGQTAAVYRAYGDADIVQRDAAEEAERVCALLRVVDPHGSSPSSRSFLQPVELYSQGNIRRALTDPTKTTCSMEERPWDGLDGMPDGLRITRESLPLLWRDAGLVHVHQLLTSDPMAAFQKDVLRALLIYARQHLTVDPVEKTIFTISAVETLLFGGQTKLDQRATKRRLSGFLAGQPAVKEHIFTCVKAAYDFRNNFLHHGRSIADTRQVENFLLVVWCFFTRVLSQQHRWPDAKAFGDAMEKNFQRRFGDPPNASKSH